MNFSVLEWIAVVTIVLVLLKTIWNVLHFIYTTFLGAWLGLNLDLRKYGPWAVVTGATDGIGKAYAYKVASLGLNVMIISRSPSKLKATAKEIKTLYPRVQVQTVAIDFTGDCSIYGVIALELEKRRIGILINNVGMNLHSCLPFANVHDIDSLDNMIRCNTTAMMRMTHMILPKMLRQKRGVIINVGSISGAFSTPLAIVYAGTKAFVERFSCDLTTELRNTGVVVQTVLPGFVMTNMLSGSSLSESSSWMIPSPQEFVEANIRTLGLESRSACFWYHKLMFIPCLQSSQPREGYEGEEVEDDSIGALIRNSFICFFFFIICVVIASIVAATMITTYNFVTAVEDEVEPVPFRVVNHGIWPGYRHEFFNERVPYLKAEQICLSRNKSSLLHFNSQEQEDKFDMYASLNFWSDTDYPAFQLWTSGFVLAKRMERGNKIIWPEPIRRGELQEIRECGVRGEGLVNAFGTSEMYWQERHIIKDYIQGNQPDISKVGGDTGCWQHIKRNDIAPERFYQFVCQRKI